MEVEFRPATEDDLELLMAWRSHPELYKYFYAQEGPLQWQEHINWWSKRNNRRDWVIVVSTDGKWRDVGNINLSKLDTETPEVGVFIGEVTLWGEGIATKAVEFAVDWLRTRDYSGAKARILEENKASKQVFERNGFRRSDIARENEYEYVVYFD